MLEISVTVNGERAEARTLQRGNTREITLSSRSLAANLPPHSETRYPLQEEGEQKKDLPSWRYKHTGFHPGNVVVLQVKEMLRPRLIFLLSFKWSLFSLEDGRKRGEERISKYFQPSQLKCIIIVLFLSGFWHTDFTELTAGFRNHFCLLNWSISGFP